MRSRGQTFNYLVFELIVDLLIFAAAVLLGVATAKGQSASQPMAMNVAAPELVGGSWLIDKKGRIRFQWIGELNYGNRGGEARMLRSF